MTTLPDNAINELFELMRLPGLAGHEQPVAAYLRQRFRPLSDEVREDVLGNVIATVNGTDPSAPAIMLFAHMDSLGFIVRRIDDDGYLWFHRLGGIPIKVVPGLRVSVGRADGGQVEGVIAVKAHHVTPPEEKAKVTPLEELFVDIGASSREQVLAAGVQIGAPVIYRGFAECLGEHRVSGTFIDNRSGCAILLEVLRRLYERRPAATVHAVGTVQEEFNLRGAQPVAHALRPDIAICVDGGAPGDTPDLRAMNDLRLGAGPVMNLYSFHGRGTLNGLIPHPALVRCVEACARERQLPLQRNAAFGGLTDASYVQLVRDGIACIDLGVLRRYTHTPVEVTDLRDIAVLVELLVGVIARMDGSFRLARALS